MTCSHVSEVNENVTPSSEGCAECLASGQQWVALRECMVCGHVGCCDSSAGKHATQHFETTHHPVMKAYPRHEWGWCYVDKTYF
jgi:uncharacterized UBP type Zn finger protein